MAGASPTMTGCAVSETKRHPARVATPQIAVARQCQQREIPAIAVVAQVEHARETNGIVWQFTPFSGPALGCHQVFDAARYRRIFDLLRGHQAKQGPGRLARRALLV